MTIWMDVDAAVTVPVNQLALIDDTDFKTRETGVAYNAAGMDLRWNVATTTGVVTSVAFTPTTGSNHDWTDNGDGLYKVEIPASGGTVNNNTEGFGWISGHITGILPFCGPVVGFRAAALNNALIDGGDNLDVNVAQWLGTTAIAGATAGRPGVDVLAVSGDDTAADNLELMYDGTGYTDSTAPSSRAQVDGIGASSGGALNFAAAEDNTGGAIKGVTFVGVETSGTYASTEAEDGTYHQIDDTGNAIDIVYGFDVGGSRAAVEFTFKGYLIGGNDQIQVFAYDFVGAGWDLLTTIAGQAGSSNITSVLPLLSKHTGSGADLGKVYVRFEETAQSNPTLFVDQILTSAVLSGQSIGYVNGAVWIDTALSNTNTESFVDGTADNPVSTIAAATTIAGNLNLKIFHLLPGSSITLAQTYNNYEFRGFGYTVALGSQSIDGCSFANAIVSGIGTNGGTRPTFLDCELGAVTIPASILIRCGLGRSGGQFTAGSAGEYLLVRCFSVVAGAGAPALVFTGLASATGINMRAWNGGATYTLDSDCTLSHEVEQGGGTTITAGGADVEIRGVCRQVTLTLSAAETVQIVGTAGPITLSGTTTATVNLYGVHGAVTDTTSAATVNDFADLNADIAENQTDLNTIISTGSTGPWTTGGGGGLTDILNVQPVIPMSIDLADTATARLGLMLTNALDDLPSTAEITPGTVDIDRKAIGGTSWASVVSGAACSEQAGMIYYDEVFDSGTGYAEGDSIRVTFKSQKITVSANDHEITDANGVAFQTEVRETMRGTNSALLASTFSTMFAGITALAEWLGLLAGKQAADATALTEIKATGAGSGTYSETTDSLEAIRDRGDSDWTTGGGGATPAQFIGGISRQGSTYSWSASVIVSGSVVDSGLSSLTAIGVFGNNGEVDLTYSASTAATIGTNHSLYGAFTLGTTPTTGVPFYLELTVVYSAVTYRGRIFGVIR